MSASLATSPSPKINTWVEDIKQKESKRAPKRSFLEWLVCSASRHEPTKQSFFSRFNTLTTLPIHDVSVISSFLVDEEVMALSTVNSNLHLLCHKTYRYALLSILKSHKEVISEKAIEYFISHKLLATRHKKEFPMIANYLKLKVLFDLFCKIPIISNPDKIPHRFTLANANKIVLQNECLLIKRLPGGAKFLKLLPPLTEKNHKMISYDISSWFKGNKKAFNKITHLNLRGLGLTLLSPKIAQLTNLKTLDLSNNHLCSLPNSISDLKKLKKLSLKKNNFLLFPPELKRLRAIKEIDLEQNDLRELPYSFAFKLTSLRFLVLSNNPHLGTLPSFANPHIRCIHLNGCIIYQ